jgi:hypothetical protein
MNRICLGLCAVVAVSCNAPPQIDTSTWHPSQRSPLTGGTLVAGPSSGRVAYASYTDLDAVARLDFDGTTVELLQLGQGTQPVRLTFDASGVLHVVLRGTGEIADVDVSGPRLMLLAKRPACAEPRGIAANGDMIYVTCLSGDLLTFKTTGGGVLTRTFVERDLRDVVVSDGAVKVSTFRSAQLITVGGARTGLPGLNVPDTEVFPPLARTYTAGTAWSMTKGDDGTLVLAYQRGVVEAVAPVAPAFSPCGGQTDAYGGSSGCGNIELASCTKAITSISHSALATLAADGTLRSFVVAGTEPVDVAVAPSGSWPPYAVALAGSAEVVGINPSVDDSALFASNEGGPVSTCDTPKNSQIQLLSTAPQLPHALTYLRGGELIVQTDTGAQMVDAQGYTHRLDLDDALLAVLTPDDQGFQMFHREAAPGSVACASCHPEATEDGRVWNLPEGVRRTQSLSNADVKVAPYHWDGAFTQFGDLMTEIFVNRMGGAPPTPDQHDELLHWLGQRPPIRSDAPASAAGKEIFEGKAGCAQCHSGERLSNGTLADVGTGGTFKVPSLVGLNARYPLMHTGCAATLNDRFNPACGGTAHGNLQSLTRGELNDLTAYLASL